MMVIMHCGRLHEHIVLYEFDSHSKYIDSMLRKSLKYPCPCAYAGDVFEL